MPEQQQDPETVQGWLSHGDAGRLFAACVDAGPDLMFGLFNGISDHKRNWLDISNAIESVGYAPRDGTARL